jgi:hypothetical protein
MTGEQQMAERSRTRSRREALDRIREGRSFALNLPIVGRVRIPHPEQAAYLGALGVLAAFELIDWPIALAIAAGHALAQNQHNKAVEEIGEALQDV